MDLLKDPTFILLKNGIIAKMYACFGELSERMKAIVENSRGDLPEEILANSPRISRGENYQALPYVMLDYPRIFSTENVFAIRTFFWWGKSFNITLHLKGRYQNMFSDQLVNNMSRLKAAGFLISQSKDEWDHDLQGSGYHPLQTLSNEDIRGRLFQDSFLKIAIGFPITRLNDAIEILSPAFELLINSLNQLPKR